MNEAISRVHSGSITYAIKDTVINGTEIKANDYMAIKDKDILLSTPQRIDAVKHLLENMVNESSEIITLIVGEGVDDPERDEVMSFIQSQLSIEVELIEGGQPVYSYLIGVE